MIKYLLILFLGFCAQSSFAQLVINEASNSNGTNYVLANGTSPDWIEIYNAGSSTINLQNYYLSDKKDNLQKWAFTPGTLASNQFLTILATGNAVPALVNHYETAIDLSANYLYHIPTGNINNWYNPVLTPSGWIAGSMSIGFGDGDDVTDLGGNVTSYYARTTFNISNFNDITKAILDIDYDDGFVAYINGIEIARSGLSGNPPNFDELAADHEAQLYAGGSLSSFNIDMSLLQNTLLNGPNLFAIEIHNANPGSSDLTAIPFLTFGFGSSIQQFNGTTHPYFLNSASGAIETNFSLSTSGETLYLSNSSGQILDSLVVPDLEPNMSVGRQQDGLYPVVIFPTPTPNASNNGNIGFDGYEATPTISTAGGFFTAGLNVNVINNSTQNGLLRYTLNGNDPSINSLPVTGPINILNNSILKVRCFPNGTNLGPSMVETETYLFNESSTIPILSVTINNVDLYGGSGIFDNWWTDWKRGCHLEYFSPDGVKLFETKASVKPDGGAGGSRSNPQHSFTVEPANSTFGTGNPVHYPIISEKPYVDDYYAMYIRNGSNFWNQYHQRDATFMRIMRKTHVNSQAYRPVNVYLNGQYFGVYELREKANEGYFMENYGNDMDSLDLLSVSYWYNMVLRTVKGSDSSFFSMINFISTYDKTSPDYLKYCDQKLDLENYTDYLIGENWIANVDWIYNNMKMARTRTFDNKWRFFLQDIEWGLGGWTDYNANMFDWFNGNGGIYRDIYSNLVQNNDYKNYFINRYADLMNTTLHTNTYTPIVQDMYEELLPEMPKHFALWTGDVQGGMNTYTYNKNLIIGQFNNRNTPVRNQMIAEYNLVKTVDVTLNVFPENAGYIKISTIIPDSLPWTGVYFDGNPVKITAVANPGFTFNYWNTNSNISQNDLNDSSLTLNISSDDLFLAFFTGIPGDTTLTISEINYNPDSTLNGGNWIELHNYGPNNINLTSYSLKSTNFWDLYSFPDGTSIPAGGYLVIAQNLNAFQSLYPQVTNVLGSTVFGWKNDGDSIYLFAPNQDTVIAFRYETTDPFPRCADGYGRTLENAQSNSQNMSADVWFCGCIAGSPGTAYLPCYEPLIVSEFNLGKTGYSYDAADWIEIYNASDDPIDLNGYVFKDSKDNHIYPLDGLVLQAGEYGLISNNQSLLNYRHNDITSSILGDFPFGISKREAIRIYNANGTLIQSVVYDTNAPWSLIPSNSDFTFEYKFDGYNQSIGTNWFIGCEGGSPGRAYAPCPLVPEGNLAWLYPNPSSSQVTIAISNSGSLTSSTSIVLYNLSGQQVSTYNIPIQIEQTIGTVIDVSQFAKGMYYFRVIKANESLCLPFVKI